MHLSIRFPRCAGGALVGLIAATFVGVTSAHADAGAERIAARGQMAGLAGSERLRMFSWGKWIETGLAPREVVEAMRGTLTRQGFYHEGVGPALVWSDAWAGPVLGYDSNINGGLTRDRFTFGDLVFESDPELRAVPGVVLAVEGGGIARLAWATGHYIETSASGTVGWAPASELTYHGGSIQVCARDNLVRWVFFDGCLLHGWSARDLASSQVDRASIALSTIFDTTAAWHEVSGQLAQTGRGDQLQATATLALHSVWDGAVTEASVTFGAPVDGMTALERRLAVEVRWLVGGKPVAIGLWHATARGGSFLGASRADESVGLTLEWQPSAGTVVEIGLSRLDSTADIHDDVDASFGVRFDVFGW